MSTKKNFKRLPVLPLILDLINIKTESQTKYQSSLINFAKAGKLTGLSKTPLLPEVECQPQAPNTHGSVDIG